MMLCISLETLPANPSIMLLNPSACCGQMSSLNKLFLQSLNWIVLLIALFRLALIILQQRGGAPSQIDGSEFQFLLRHILCVRILQDVLGIEVE